MLAEANARTPLALPVRYVEGDFRTALPDGEQFDVVTAVAALHHLPIDEALCAAAARVKEGGTLLVVDLHEGPSLPAPARAIGRWCLDTLDAIRRGAPGRPDVKAAWAAHGEHERLPLKQEVRRAVADVLPEATLRFHLRWRWTLHAIVRGRLIGAGGGKARG